MRLRHGIGFAVFCLLAGSRWLVDAARLETLPPLLGQSLHFAAAGMVALIVSIARKSDARRSKAEFLPVAFAGLLLLGVPSLIGPFTSKVSSETSVALFAMAPICVVVHVAMTSEPARALLMPSLAGFAGALLLLSWRLPSTRTETMAFGVVLIAAVLTAVGSVWTHTLIRGTPFLLSVAVVTLSNAVILGIACMVQGEKAPSFGQGDYVALVIALPQIFLLVWLIAGVAPERLAARFLLVPLLTIVEGALVLRALPNARMVVGVLLLLFGAGTLLRSKHETTLSLRLR